MSKIYFIDSENVGDNWISLLDTVTSEDEILVFYTANSPHMNYKNIIHLKESTSKVEFIECCEGNNALDFQLCTYLGSLIPTIADNDFVIVTNDTGFDAVVKFWKERKKSVSRIKGSACSQKPKQTTKSSSPNKTESEAKSKAKTKKSDSNKDLDLKAMEILYCIGKENLSQLHTALQLIFGSDKGKSYYDAFKKKDPKYDDFIENHIKLTPEEKYVHYCKIVFDLSKPKMTMPKDFPLFVIETWKKKKNLNSLRSELQNKYKNEYDKYYSIIKGHVKILINI